MLVIASIQNELNGIMQRWSRKKRHITIFHIWWQGCWKPEKGFEGSFSARHDIDEFIRKQIAPTRAMKVPPSAEELMKAPSIFAMKPKVTENFKD